MLSSYKYICKLTVLIYADVDKPHNKGDNYQPQKQVTKNDAEGGLRSIKAWLNNFTSNGEITIM